MDVRPSVRGWSVDYLGGYKVLKMTYLGAALAAALLFVLPTAPAQAQATRTWVSGVGDDVNPCSRTAPCKTWAGAISKTAAGGEIDALDPAGFGALTITKAITLDGGGGQVASTLVAATNGFTVSAGPNDVVLIRNIQINGVLGTAAPGINGISFTSGAMLSVENCAIFGFSQAGISVTTSAAAILNVTNSNITNAANGINLAPTGGTLRGQVDHTTIQKLSGNGVTATGSVIFAVANSNILNAAGTAVNASGTGVVLDVDSSAVSNNSTGFATSGGFIRVTRNTIYDNVANFSISGGGTIATAGNNMVAVNGATAPNGTVTQQ
jgi:hypothetical protein